ncbi:hypothetical protein AtEden1_Chr4g0316931 [Arabidopsis thaliana]
MGGHQSFHVCRINKPNNHIKGEDLFSSQFQDFHNYFYIYTLPYHAKVYDFRMVKLSASKYIILFLISAVYLSERWETNHTCVCFYRVFTVT